jgi:hypothetical protein
MGKEKRAAIYLRVSTGEQTVGNQRRELETAAASRGWSVVAVYADEGISGAKGREAACDGFGCSPVCVASVMSASAISARPPSSTWVAVRPRTDVGKAPVGGASHRPKVPPIVHSR